MRSFVIRMISLLAVVFSLASYQAVGAVRERDEKISELTAELAAKEEELGALTEGLDEISTMLRTADVDAKAAEEAAQEESGPYTDGSYQGEAQGYGGLIALTVTVEGGYISDITVDSHDAEDLAYFTIASGVIPKILESQSTDVDTVTGATLSSAAICSAVSQALEGAMK